MKTIHQFENQTFERINYNEQPLERGEYDNCRFINCQIAGVDLSQINFIECEFEHCDLSMSPLGNTAFRNVKFRECKLLGLHFEDCNSFLFEVAFHTCILRLSSFFSCKLKNTIFQHCDLQEVDFGEADLSESVFDACDFLGAIFDRSNLEKCDFSTAFNYSIDPLQNKMKKAKFSKERLLGLLYAFDLDVV